MRSNPFQRIALQFLIILSIAFWGTAALASCGWVLTSTKCATDSDPHGAFCDDAQCNCGDYYNKTDVKKIRRCRQPAWLPPGNLCSPYLLQDEIYEWQPDPNDPCCGSSDPCCGKGPCCNNPDPCCGKEDDPCCKDPCSCKCCDGNDSTGGKM